MSWRQLFAAMMLVSGSAAMGADESPVRHRIMLVEYGTGKNRILEVAEDGKPVWEHRPESICVHCQPLANGHVVYACGGSPTRVQEVDREHKVVWNYFGRCEQIMTSDRLPGGNTLVAEQGPCRVVEVDPRGKIALAVNVPVKAPSAHNQMRCVHALDNGHLLVANEDDAVVREIDADGQVVWECPAGKFVYEAIRLKSGNTLIGCGTDKRVIEVTPQKKIVWELTAGDVPEVNLNWITSLQVLQNGNYVICNFLRGQEGRGAHAFEITRDKKVVWNFADHSLVGMATTVKVLEEPSPSAAADLVLAEFEDWSYGDWQTAGEAFGLGPAPGRLATQGPVGNFEGQGLVNSFVQRDKTQGTLTSPEFEITRAYINFLIGGGARPALECVNLLVGDKVVRTATGRNSDELEQSSWDVRDLLGQKARLQVVDKSSGAWGYILADHFVESAHRRGRLVGNVPDPHRR